MIKWWNEMRNTWDASGHKSISHASFLWWTSKQIQLTNSLSFSPLSQIHSLKIFHSHHTTTLIQSSTKTSDNSTMHSPLSQPFFLLCILRTTERKWFTRGNYSGKSFHIQRRINWGWFFFLHFFTLKSWKVLRSFSLPQIFNFSDFCHF